jgi:predicted TIM-barrel fold metal-dependent hydrolase
MSSQRTSEESDNDDLALVDCDVHHTWRDEAEVAEYLPDHYRDRGVSVPGGLWSTPISFMREDAIPEDGNPAGSDPGLMKEQLLDRYGIDYAVLCSASNPGALGVTPNADYAMELATAYNKWLIERWLDDDERFLGSLMVAPQTPRRAAEEIRKRGSHPQIAQVQMSSISRSPYGGRQYWPIYEAAEEMGLPVALHIGQEAKGFSFPQTAAGYPGTYFGRHVLNAASFQGQLVSMVLEGVFVEFPDLRLVLIEGGFSWLPYIRWRLDKNWKALQEQVPWLEQPPSEYITDHVRFTTQPVPEPKDPDLLLQMFDMIDAEETLLFASDYPHWDADDPQYAFPPMPDSLERAVFSENARELYGL